jgi:hypothetical protein
MDVIEPVHGMCGMDKCHSTLLAATGEADSRYEDAARRHKTGAIPAKEHGAHGDFATLSPSASMIARYALSWFSR